MLQSVQNQLYRVKSATRAEMEETQKNETILTGICSKTSPCNRLIEGRLNARNDSR